MQTLNPSVLLMIEELNAVIESAPMPLQDLVDRLDVHLSCIAIGVDVRNLILYIILYICEGVLMILFKEVLIH